MRQAVEVRTRLRKSVTYLKTCQCKDKTAGTQLFKVRRQSWFGGTSIAWGALCHMLLDTR